jgi:hypothetical protein
MDYEDLKMDLRKSCPPILNSAYHVSEVPQERHTEKVKAYSKKMTFQTLRNFKKNENMLLRPLGMLKALTFGMYIARTKWRWGMNGFEQE